MSKILAFFRLIRVVNLLIIVLSTSFFYYFIIIPVHNDKLHTTLVPFTQFDFILFVLSIVFIAAAGNIINDYFDFESDREFKPGRPLSTGAFSLDTAIYLHTAFAIAGIAIGFYLGWTYNNFKLGYVNIICVLLLYVYSSYLKKIPLVGNVVISALTAFIFVFLLLYEANFLRTISFEGSEYAFSILIWQVKFYAGFAFLINLAREIVKDIEDKEGDKVYKITTLPVQFGEKAAKMVSMIALFILFAALALFMNGFLEAHAVKEFSYLLFAVVIPLVVSMVLLFLAKDKKQYATVSLMLKIVMLLGVLSIPAFYFFNKV